MHPVMLHLLCNAVHVTSETCPGLLRAEKKKTAPVIPTLSRKQSE
jgi:hypothetical protein